MEAENPVIQFPVVLRKEFWRWLSCSRQARKYMQSFSKLKESVCEQISVCAAVQEKAITEEIQVYKWDFFFNRFKSAVVSEYLRTLKITKLQTVQPKHA